MTIKNLNAAEKHLVGMSVPKEENGNIGRLVEDELEKLGYPINRKVGCDTAVFGEDVEIKTRKLDAKAAQTVGIMAFNDIKKTPYDSSLIKEKFQQQFRVYFDDDKGVIVSAKMYDFRDEFYQNILREGYEAARALLVKQGAIPYARGGHRSKKMQCYFELQDGKSYKFRLSATLVKKFERGHNSNFNKLFSKEE